MEKETLISKIERGNQIIDRKSYFHTFSIQGYVDQLLPKRIYWQTYVYPYWIILKHNPYMPIFKEKILISEETGLNQKFWDKIKLFKITEDEPLEALKLEHFYITLIGIVFGILMSLIVFIGEGIRPPK